MNEKAPQSGDIIAYSSASKMLYYGPPGSPHEREWVGDLSQGQFSTLARFFATSHGLSSRPVQASSDAVWMHQFVPLGAAH